MKQPVWKQFIFIMLALSLAACGSDESETELEIIPQYPAEDNSSAAQRGDWVSIKPIGTVAQSIYSLLLLSGKLPSVNWLDARYSVGTYKVVYITEDASGNPINASGVIAFPAKSAGALSPILGYQHPTIFLDSEAPSNTASNDIYTYIASSLGYIMVLPDYIGYGESSNQIHTYVHAKGLANATVDMLRAAKQYIAHAGIGWNNQLFLTGYSEGGYANMAAHRELETKLSAEFTVTAAVHGGGPYDVRGTMDAMLSSPYLASPAYVGFVFKAYDSIYSLDAIATAYQSQHVSTINTYFDGQYSSSATDAKLGTNITTDLFKALFLIDYNAGTESSFTPNFNINEVYNWTPLAPTRLYHGEHDDIVPYANAITAMAAMSGAADINLKTCTIPLDAHALCIPGYLDYMIDYFSSKANNL